MPGATKRSRAFPIFLDQFTIGKSLLNNRPELRARVNGLFDLVEKLNIQQNYAYNPNFEENLQDIAGIKVET